MIKLTVNHAKSHLPLRKAKGSPQDRLQKAIQMNEQFFENIKDCFQEGDVHPKTYAKILKMAAGAPIKIEIAKSNNRNLTQGGRTCINFNELGQQIGYMIFLPFNAWSNKISKMSTLTFMHENLHFFERILNPKYTARDIAIINKGYDARSIKEFYDNNLYIRKELKKKDLNSFLKGKSLDEAIDSLQELRYNLKMELNAHKYTKSDQRKIENHYCNTISYREKLVNYSDYQFPQKIKMLEEKLASVLQKARAKNKSLVL